MVAFSILSFWKDQTPRLTVKIFPLVGKCKYVSVALFLEQDDESHPASQSGRMQMLFTIKDPLFEKIIYSETRRQMKWLCDRAHLLALLWVYSAVGGIPVCRPFFKLISLLFFPLSKQHKHG